MNDKREQEINDPNYRPISALAIVSLAFSLLSIAALFHLAFVPVCIAGLVFALVALVRIGSSDKQYVGTQLVWVAIFLSCMFGFASVSFYMWKSEYRWATAQTHADAWLQLLQAGEKAKVHHLTLPNFDRQPEDVDLAVYYAPENLAVDPSLRGRQPQTGYKTYWTDLEPQKTILADGAKGKIEFLRRDKYEKKPDGELFVLVYRYIPADPGLRKKTGVGKNNATITFPLEFTIRMHRANATAEAGIQWHVHQVSIEGVDQSNQETQIQ